MFRLPAAALIAAFVATPAAAIIIRHDVADAAYLGRESDFPAVFGLYRTRAGKLNCGATVISPRWAVTAAHCTEAKRLLEAVRPGGPGYEVSVAGRAVLIDRVVVHPDPASDLALLRFSVPVEHVAPVPLHRGTDELGRTVVMPGWGVFGNGKTGVGEHDGVFRVAENVVDRAEGGRLYWRFDGPGEKSAALRLEGISGPGDSGGPALVATPGGWAIAGVSSSQDTRGGPEGLYGVVESFVRVSAFAAWIDRETTASGS